MSDNYWWCDSCKIVVDDSMVVNDSIHISCGAKVKWKQFCEQTKEELQNKNATLRQELAEKDKRIKELEEGVW